MDPLRKKLQRGGSWIISVVQLTKPRYLIFGSRTAINFPSKATHWDIISFSASRCITCDAVIQRNVKRAQASIYLKKGNMAWAQPHAGIDKDIYNSALQKIKNVRLN